MENGPFIDGLPICISLVGALEHGFYFAIIFWE